MWRVMIPCLIALSFISCDANKQGNAVKLEATATDCDAAKQRCHVQLDGIDVYLSLEPGLVPLKPFAIVAEIAGSDVIESPILDFQMVGMEMGPNRYRLLAEGDVWRGTATLPVCTTSRSDWLAILEFQQGSQRYRVGFPFTTR